MAHSREEIEHHVKIYVRVFVSLMVLTVVTVAVAKVELPMFWAVAVAMFIASIKGGLVGAFFMHLTTEKKIIFACLALTIIFFVFLMVLPSMTTFDPIEVTHGT